jgi:molybdopterin-containing oxidoreductase family membrane subunit
MFPYTGMWFERFVFIVTSIHRDFLPSSWGYFSPTWVDITLFIGTIGLFNFLFLLFVRFLPIINMFEDKGITPQADPHAEDHSTSLNHSSHSDSSLSTRVHA